VLCAPDHGRVVPEDRNLHGKPMLVTQIKHNQMQAQHKYLNKLRVCILAVVLILAAVGALQAQESPSRICDGENVSGRDLFYFFRFPLSVFSLPIMQIHLPSTNTI